MISGILSGHIWVIAGSFCLEVTAKREIWEERVHPRTQVNMAIQLEDIRGSYPKYLYKVLGIRRREVAWNILY